MLVGSFRRGQAEDPAQYVTAVATVLAAYPEWVVRTVTHPLDGLPSKSDWLPHVSEVKGECDRHMQPIRDEIAREHREAAARLQIEERRQEDEGRDHRPTLDELHARFGKTWGIEPPEERRRPSRSLEEMIGDPLPPLSEAALAIVHRRSAA